MPKEHLLIRNKIATNFGYRSRGFSLVELLVAVSVFMVFVVAVSGTTQTVTLQSRNSSNKERAAILAEEALEAARNIRDYDFTLLVDGTHGLASSSNQWIFSASPDVTDIFTRTINVSTITADQKKVDVTINWADQISPVNSLSMSTYLTNWHAVLNRDAGLTVNKTVINHGGSLVAANFAPYMAGTSTLTVGVASQLAEGTYTVSEVPNSSYTQTFSGDCNSSGVVNLVGGGTYSCTITNEEKLSYLTVIKSVVNHGLSKVASSFTLTVDSVMNSLGEILYFVAIERDITREKEIDKAKTEFVSLASHQLRTPLSSINWYTEMLMDGDAGPINDEQRKYLNEVAVGNQRMITLVNSLLNVSRLDLGTFIVEPEPTNLKDLTKSVIEELHPLIVEKKLTVNDSYDEKCQKFVADPKLLRMVIQNLLSNATKYTPAQGTVTVSLKAIPGGETYGNHKLVEESLGISVSDTGIGIPAAQKEKIFSKLFRADNARESETEGTGLGLYIIKSIVDQSGGNIWFVSEENKGTTFYISFPITGMKKKEGTKKLDE